MTTTHYFFRNGTFFCLTGGFIFVLDLRRNEYDCASERDYKLVSRYIASRGAPSPPLAAEHGSNDQDPDLPPAAMNLLTEFTKKGILTTDPNQAQIRDPTPTQCPTATLIDAAAEISSCATITQMVAFARATFHAHTCLKYRALESTVRRIKSRKQTHLRSTEPFDLAKAAKVLSVFQTLRPFFPRSYLCIFDSLALLEFFATHGLFPTWVFGIQAEPFEAHCWLQQDSVVINDRVHRVNKLTRIMTV